MSAAPKITTYAFRVLAGDIDDPTEYNILTIGRDIQRTEQMFAENGWGSTTSRPMTSATAVAYFAMMRTGMYAGTWKDFESWYLSIEPVEPVNAYPTDPGPIPG